MRWLLIDEFVEINKGKSATGVRCVTRAERSLTHSYPSFPVFSASLMLEMMAQVGGVLAGATIDFTKEVVLAKISNASFNEAVVPPQTLRIEAALSDLNDRAARTQCRITSEERVVAEAHIFFGLFDKLDVKRKGGVVFSDNFMKTYAIREIIKASKS